MTLHPTLSAAAEMTRRWIQTERQQCETCAHIQRSKQPADDGGALSVLRCGLAKPLTTIRGRPFRLHCIDARAPGQKCGPGAELWEARVSTGCST
jgi:hypothetical protein